MKKTYSQPTAEVVSLNTYEIMQGLNIPVSGGTTPEESDAKPGFFDDECDGYGLNYEDLYRNQSSSPNLWDD
ncbi:MAG: hypothetical protein SOY49_05405 [Prevotella sp.]|nr:hypothetical protein [Prevotella sp.]